jgi:hypothetical protein
MSCRLIVRDFSKQTAPADLEALFSKICPVLEVYIADSATPTGLVRNFAIVRLDTFDSEVAHKCVKAFNGCLWKGSKIKVEKANNMFYKDKFDRERKEAVVTDTEETTPTDTEEEKEPIKIFSHSYVKLKKTRLSLAVKISTKPRTGKVDPKNAKNGVAACGNRIVFLDNVDGTDNASQTSEECPSSDDDDDEDNNTTTTINNNSNNNNKKGITDSSKDLNGKPANGTDAPIVKTVEGGGKRRGFGTLLQESTATIEVKAATLNKQFEEADQPCISAEDLSEAALQKERNRALDFLSNMTFTLPAPTVATGKKAKLASRGPRAGSGR